MRVEKRRENRKKAADTKNQPVGFQKGKKRSQGGRPKRKGEQALGYTIKKSRKR